ncbi:thioredoxin family protein [Amnibacterium sp. CER49]|uniref:TlpA family protein disulfide reductase n=1 Tax=Amnibacterium sp. CER49 TaxID=3039161 RepID=UPI0024484AB5|nr:thioredoxin family protein [Amnibacterium sp. CER49]MDH2444228.1 thioredoxin family protein [Amnibacterium sp. CER49]
MTPLAAAGVLAALVVLCTAAGLVARARGGRVRSADALVVAVEDVAPQSLGARATLLQFSTPTCSPCRAAGRLLAGVAAGADGVAHVELDLAARPALAARYRVLSVPTAFLLDAQGVVRARITGVPREPELRSALAALEADHAR